MLLSSHSFAQTNITFDDQGWDADQCLNSSFTIGNLVISGSKPFYTNYGYNFNVDNTCIYFHFLNSTTDQLTIAKTGGKLFNMKSISAYQVSEAGTGSLIIEGWNGSTKQYTSTFTDISNWKDLSLNFKNINKLVIRSNVADGDSITDYDFDNFVIDNSITSVENSQVFDYSLDQNYPNPFNPSTLIKYQIPEEGFVTLKVYDSLGNEICTLVNENKPAGNYSAVFNAENLASGTYIYKLSSNGYLSSKKMILIK